jgi:polyphosphate kinase
LPHLTPPERFNPKSINTLETLQTAFILPDGFWVKIPKNLPQVLGKRSHRKPLRWDFFFLDQLLSLFLGPPTPSQWTAGLVRLTRDGDYEYDLADTDSESIPELVRTRIGSRDQGRPIRLQISGNISESLREITAKAVGLDDNFVFESPGTLFLQSLWSVYRALQDDFQETPLYFQTSPPKLPALFLNRKTLFDKIATSDILLHHPYDSFDAIVLFIETATKDSQVSSIEITIYRTDALSPILEFLKAAAKTKKICVTIELRARFDEWNNLSIASDLKKAGVKVFYGFGKLKLHAKMALVTRKEPPGIKRYTHLSTGNYHSATARTYTDLAILTADESIGEDVRHFFDSVYKGIIPEEFKQLVVAPQNLSRRVQSLIQKEIQAAQAGKTARIFAKVNALVDENTIESLYKASQAGVRVDLIVRGACSLVPGIKGISDNIRVFSVLDYYLEHSRIYYFESSRKLYFSSADWMPRNFLRRLEIAFPVLDQRIYNYVRDVVLPAYLKDNVQGKELTSKGHWRSRQIAKGESAFRAQHFFKELSETEYKGTPLE